MSKALPPEFVDFWLDTVLVQKRTHGFPWAHASLIDRLHRWQRGSDACMIPGYATPPGAPPQLPAGWDLPNLRRVAALRGVQPRFYRRPSPREFCAGLVALSVRQPWASLMFLAGDDRKDIENRKRRTGRRGRVLIHASKTIGAEERVYAHELRKRIPKLPELEALPRGGVIGSVYIVDCVGASGSPWFTGPHGYLLANPDRAPGGLIPCRGALGFFTPDIA